jgi:hypothetical protein
MLIYNAIIFRVRKDVNHMLDFLTWFFIKNKGQLLSLSFVFLLSLIQSDFSQLANLQQYKQPF